MKSLEINNFDVLRVKQVLGLASQAYAQLTRQFPKEKISQRINELKYLTAQKKVPRLSLRREILHLEEQLQSVLQVEAALQKQEKRESEKITQLKTQNELLRKRLAAAEDKDLQKKVNKLSHLLTEAVAHKEIKRDVAASSKMPLSEKLPKLLEGKITPPPLQAQTKAPASTTDLTELEQRLGNLKLLLQQKRGDEGDAASKKLLEERISQLQEKIKLLKSKS